jgi:hypothetical protein
MFSLKKWFHPVRIISRSIHRGAQLRSSGLMHSRYERDRGKQLKSTLSNDKG